MGRMKELYLEQQGMYESKKQPSIVPFAKFHRNNMIVFHLIVHYADESLKKRNRYSIEDILSIIRWHRDEDTVGDIFKLNNNYKAYYGRMYMQYRKQPNFFETRGSLADHYNFDMDIKLYKEWVSRRCR